MLTYKALLANPDVVHLVLLHIIYFVLKDIFQDGLCYHKRNLENKLT